MLECSNIFGYLGQKYLYQEYPYLDKDCCFVALVCLLFFVLTHLFLLITMGQLTDTHKEQIVAYPNANHRLAEIGSKIGFSKSAICKFFSFNSGGMSASGDFAIPMSFPRERDPGTGTNNKIVTDWQLSVMRIQMNKNPSMTA